MNFNNIAHKKAKYIILNKDDNITLIIVNLKKNK
jgi:hypothetical protein